MVVLACLVPGVAWGQASLPDAPSSVIAQAEQAPLPALDNFLDGNFSAVLPPSPCIDEASTQAPCTICCVPADRRFQQFVKLAGGIRPMTPQDKLLLAGRNTVDPFNALTILGSSAIEIAFNPHTSYGPGLRGVARNSAVVFTEGVTSDFFSTFLIPSLAGQDPHYHRMPNASTRRRIAHALYQVVWTQSDTGRPMFNYATVFGTIATDAVNDLYVPGRELGPGSSAARIGTAIATDPIDNFITEFVPDLARRVKFHVVFVQRIINRVALEEGRNAAD